MKTFVQMLFNAAMLTMLVVLALNQRKASDAQRAELMNELRPMKEELRKMNAELERVGGDSLRQQAAIETVEAALKMRMTSESGRANRPAAPALHDEKPAMVSVDRAAAKELAENVTSALSRPDVSSAVATAKAAMHPEGAGKAPAAPVTPPAAPVDVAPAAAPSTDEAARKTLVFSSTSTGTTVREIIEESAVSKPAAAKPASATADSLSTGLPDIAALVSTSIVHTASTTGEPAKQVEVPATNKPPVIPKRVTSAPSTTGTPEPGVPPVRKSALGRKHEREGGSLYPLSLSEQMLGSSTRRKEAQPVQQPVETVDTPQAPGTNAVPGDATE